ncbi:hypothetical protein B0H13DRAFT_1895941 [Mycena leptocephala]|nr:hypothetical protein B0H13DRAFT_1895941 [Mycena leptocephala]
MSRNNVRMKKQRNPSVHSTQTLVEEVVAVGAALDSDVGDTGHRISDLDLAVKWGLPHDVVQATEGVRVTRSSRSTMPKCLEMSRPADGAVDYSAATRLEMSCPVDGAVDYSAAMRLEMSRPVDGVMDYSAANDLEDNVVEFSAVGELALWSLPAVNCDALSANSAPHAPPPKKKIFLETITYNRSLYSTPAPTLARGSRGCATSAFLSATPTSPAVGFPPALLRRTFPRHAPPSPTTASALRTPAPPPAPPPASAPPRPSRPVPPRRCLPPPSIYFQSSVVGPYLFYALPLL